MYKIIIKDKYNFVENEKVIDGFDTYESAASYLHNEGYVKQGSKVFYKDVNGMTFKANIVKEDNNERN